MPAPCSMICSPRRCTVCWGISCGGDGPPALSPATVALRLSRSNGCWSCSSIGWRCVQRS
eukprot:9967952-Prorocentrum_lima.AAC.1